MQTPDYYYRRRFLDGRRYIFHDYGPALVWRDDELWGCDFFQAEPAPIGVLKGFDLAGRPGVIVPKRNECRYGRVWAWRTRPLLIVAMYGPDGTLAATRIDYATPLHTYGGALYQTDLYLDIFVAADGRKYLIDDHEELEQALATGLITPERYELVRAQEQELIEVLRAGALEAWLGPQPPFEPAVLPAYRSSDGRYIAADQTDGWPEGLD
jgi:hypothetical protein